MDALEERDEKIEGLELEAIERNARKEELVRPRIEIWPDPYYDEWTDWVRSHERKKQGNPVDLCEIMKGMGGSPLCPIGLH